MAAESRSARHQLSNEHSGARAGAGRYESHPIHGSLVRHTLTLGVERHVVALEITVCLAVVLGVGVSVPALCLVAVVALAIHPALAWATARDPLATEVYIRSRSYADYYAPHATAHAALHTHVPRPRASLPKVR
jgi:type IV secretory pathway TrbD component